MVWRRLAAAIDELLDTDPAALSDAELHETVVELQRQTARLAAVRARHVGEWDARRVWADNGAKTGAARLAREAKLAGATASREVRRARRLRHMPHTAAALAAGVLSVDQADVLARANQPRLADQFAAFEEQLVADAIRLARFKDLERVVRYWQHHADALAEEDQARRQRAGREAHAARTFDGTVVLRGVFDPIDGDIVLTELQRLENELFEADWAAARAEHGDQAGVQHLARTAAQRRADALVEMARRSAARPAGAVPAQPLFSVVVDLGTFTRTICELADGTVIAPGSLLAHLDEADVERIVFDGPARVIEVGARTRLFNAAQRRAIIVRDRHCQHPAGCDVPAEDCQIDHIIEHSDGGETTLDNGRALCRTHNRQRPGRRRAPPSEAA